MRRIKDNSNLKLSVCCYLPLSGIQHHIYIYCTFWGNSYPAKDKSLLEFPPTTKSFCELLEGLTIMDRSNQRRLIKPVWVVHGV